ncbi:MAG: GNAT family N-acetyltransferase [Desulfobulbaceae bacterium]|jgi:predicted N-acetyltransferase YhbS|nr:GNAT family N-acetyltransferase [Desulfobulbaceae bacterium]
MIVPPAPISADHELQDFDCGRDSLNHWLKKQALKNESGHASRTFVTCTENNQVVGYYALASGSIERNEAPGKIKRKMPDPISVLVLGRLAVDLSWQGDGFGLGLLKDALYRCLSAASVIGARAVLVHALDEEAQDFYKKFGFIESPANSLTLLMGIFDIEKIFK